MQACEVVVRIEDFAFENKEAPMAIYQGVLLCLRDAHLPVRVNAALALPTLLNYEGSEFQKPILRIFQDMH